MITYRYLQIVAAFLHQRLVTDTVCNGSLRSPSTQEDRATTAFKELEIRRITTRINFTASCLTTGGFYPRESDRDLCTRDVNEPINGSSQPRAVKAERSVRRELTT